MKSITRLKNKVLEGASITEDEAMSLVDLTDQEYDELLEAATEITARFGSKDFDSCSIINARSGRCPEDCKWCAQSAHHTTDISVYPLVDREIHACLAATEYSQSEIR